MEKKWLENSFISPFRLLHIKGESFGLSAPLLLFPWVRYLGDHSFIHSFTHLFYKITPVCFLWMRRVAYKATWCPPPGLPVIAGEMSRENAGGGGRSMNLGFSSSGRCCRSTLRRTDFSLAFWASENRGLKSMGQGALPAWCLKPTRQVL